MMNRFGLLLLMILVAASAMLPKDIFETIDIEGGKISGTVTDDGAVHIFKGIPFAAPPLGDLRWKAPQPVIPWQGVKACDAFGASPMQGNPVPFGPWSEEYLIPKESISEDCLTLNVWTGARSPKDKLPVIVWIYGGGFVSGGTGCAVYDGTAMARKGVVFVSVNYRVGIFGFFAHPALTEESPNNASGNYGLMDQIAGLAWVKKNITAFGGDPDNVTIAGQSAGSMSVNALVASPLCKDLFHRAIAESGGGLLSPPGGPIRLQQAEEAGARIAQSIGKSTLAELRAVPADELFRTAKGSFRPVVDGHVLPESVGEIFAANKQNHVPLLTGWNEDEGGSSSKPKTAAEFTAQIKERYGNDADAVLRFYPSATDEEAASSQWRLSRDQTFGSQNYAWALRQSDAAKARVYVYRFTRKLPATGDYVKFGAFHTGEVAYAYDNLEFVKRCPWEQVDHKIASTMSSFWVNFARSGDPNGKGLPHWPAFNSKDTMVMFFSEKAEAKPLPDKAALDFLVGKAK